MMRIDMMFKLARNVGRGDAIVNRLGNVHSAGAAAGKLDQAIALCSVAGFLQIRMRGDCKFSQTEHPDRWDALGLKFNLGHEGRAALRGIAENLPPIGVETTEVDETRNPDC
jgi:hypothetical protein